MTKEDVKSVPAWVQIHKLPLKFWGKGLPKIAGLIGKFIKSDAATEERTRLGYARVMVELVVDQELPPQVAFKDEKGSIIRVDVEYEWRPIKCKKCMGMGHDLEHCRKGTQEKFVQKPVKKVWRPVVKQNALVKPQENNVIVTTVQKVPVVSGTVTPHKRLVRMHRQEGDKSGYNTESFGAHSYKDVLASPSKMNGGDNSNGLFGLLETKIKSRAHARTVNNFNNWCISTNNGYHNSGRICVLWDPKIFRIQFLEYNSQFIHMKVETMVSRSVVYLTMIYAFNNIHERAPLWDHLRRIAGLVDGPWAIAGDFNCVLSATERVGGNTPTAEIDPFRTCVLDYGIVDIPAIGSLFTWNNKQRPEDRIYSKIDRFMTNKAWSDHFPDLYANFLPEGMLDHTPYLISSSTQVQKTRSFKYYNMWGASKEFLPTITQNWSNSIHGTPLFRLTKNLKLLKPALKALNWEKYSDIENSTAIMQRRVSEL
ncbi:uncharacterized protein LOC141601386 [Silene latifolia]|uniref:uncharacterized protein LOC141601386 n=1 Tax=Silene latifolia TaxID=37657 RepID=UPI003D77CEAE